MKIHREGHLIILIVIILLISLNTFIFYFINYLSIKYSLLFSSVAILGLVINFFRVPNRNVIINDDHIIAPSDGKLVVMEEVIESEYLNKKCVQLSIFMSPLNVHKQWYPTNGVVECKKYHPGKYLVAWNPKSSIENERSTIVIKNKKGHTILFRQIAGAVARRICTYSSVNQIITQKDEAGFIKFGSRIDVFIPLTATIKVELEQKIIGGETVLATI